MKILVTVHYFVPHHGGIENVAFNQAKILSANGHDVTVVTSDVPKDFTHQGAYKVIRIPAWNILENRLGIPFPIFSPKLYRVLKNEVSKADIIQAHGHVYLPSVVAARFAASYKKPFILTQHNTFIEYKSSVLRFMQHIADRSLGKYTIARANTVIAVSQASGEYISKILPVESLIQYNGVDTTRFKPSAHRSALRRKLGLPIDKKICFSVRRITFKNGIDTMIECAKILKDESDIVFVIGGKGPDLDFAKKMVNDAQLDNVLLLGAIDNEDLPHYYACSDIFVLPSKNGEGFPLVVLEALASGVPVLATRSGGHVEILESSNHGFVVEPNNPQQMANILKEVIEKPKRLAAMKRTSRKFAEQSLSWEKNVGDLQNLFDKAIA